MTLRHTCCIAACGLIAATLPAFAGPITFSTGNPTNSIGMASRPGVGGKIEIEAADDFPIGGTGAQINSATFTGVIVSTGGGTPTLGEVDVEIYRIFPLDSNTIRTPNVPTRANSPSDVEFDSRDTAAGNLTYTTTVLAASFSALNSVLNGINPSPNQTTLGEGPITGSELQFNLSFTTPFTLAPGHYFFVPQVQVTGGEFYWLSAARPIVSPGTPFPAGVTDLQAWMRNANLDPDWLRVGTDIVGSTTFNGAFSLTGVDAAVPEPASVLLVSAGLSLAALLRRRRQ